MRRRFFFNPGDEVARWGGRELMKEGVREGCVEEEEVEERRDW